MKDTIQRALVTGGAGFIGCNLADRLLSRGCTVVILDNLARAGSDENLRWLAERHGSRLEFVQGDIRDRALLRQVLNGVNATFHLAAQVAVTHSLDAPWEDFSINAVGTLGLLEEIRQSRRDCALFFTSTNKVYGELSGLSLRRGATRYESTDSVDESFSLQGLSPYGCSKLAAEQYVLDYAHSYSLPFTVFRMSCIYGPRQNGTSDQGWVSHFLAQAMTGEPITIFGDGRQVRDLLYVEDLVSAFELGWRKLDRVAGEAFNLGGGMENATSLLELLELLATYIDRRPIVRFADWRVGDQRYFVTNYHKFQRATGWRPHSNIPEGIALQYHSMTELGRLAPLEYA